MVRTRAGQSTPERELSFELVFMVFEPCSLDLAPEGRTGRCFCRVKHFGNLLPIKSSAISAKHGSPLVGRLATRFSKTPEANY